MTYVFSCKCDDNSLLHRLLPPGMSSVRQWKDDLYIEIDMIITSCG